MKTEASKGPKKPAFGLRYYWTWDLWTNWVLDAAGLHNYEAFGESEYFAGNDYLKDAATFVEDYKRLIDHCVRMDVNGIVIWGFVRDSHGGIAASQEVAAYAAEHGVHILPGVGTSAYGGFYYQGKHRFNVDTWLAEHPELRRLDEKGVPRPELCPSLKENQQWLRDGMQWLFDTFKIGGVNLENGDFQVCHHPASVKARAELGMDVPNYYAEQLLSYLPALEAALTVGSEKWITYATYSGFGPQPPQEGWLKTGIGNYGPLFAEHYPQKAVAQWTVTGMVHREQPLPLEVFLEDGTPREMSQTPDWPQGCRPPTARSTGFMHQGSQWWRDSRHKQVIGWIKEMCLRAYQSGLEGVSIHGEVTDRNIPNRLNYLAFSYFTHEPEGSLRDFAGSKLSKELGSEEDAQTFVELLARWDAGKLTEKDKGIPRKILEKHQHTPSARRLQTLLVLDYWQWMEAMVNGRVENHTRSWY